MSDLDWLRKWANYFPDKVAVVDLDTQVEYTYKALHRYASQMVSYLKANYKEGDRIAVLAEQSSFTVVLAIACQRLGVILVPINYRLSPSEISNLLKDCEPSLVIYSEWFAQKIGLEKDY